MGKRKIKKYKKELEDKNYKIEKISKNMANLSDDEREELKELKEEYKKVSGKLNKLNDRDYEKVIKKDKKISDLHRLLSDLEYQREDCLQHLNQLKMEEEEVLQTLENAKIIRDVNAIKDAEGKLSRVKAEIAKVDKRLNKIIARIAMNSIRKAKLQETVIAEFEKYAEKYDIDEFSVFRGISRAKSAYREQDATRREKQKEKYRKDNLARQREAQSNNTQPTNGNGQGGNAHPTSGNGQGRNTQRPNPPKRGNPMPRELDDITREKLEEESIERYASRKPVRIGRFFIRIWARFWLIKNKLFNSANEGLLSAGRAIQNRAEKDRLTFKEKMEKFKKQYEMAQPQKKKQRNLEQENQEHENSNEDPQQE